MTAGAASSPRSLFYCRAGLAGSGGEGEETYSYRRMRPQPRRELRGIAH